jgi:hypothetical protein
MKLTLVLATPISGPALMWTPQCVSREIVFPTVLMTPTQSAPLSKQYRIAKIVSAVSPLTQEDANVISEDGSLHIQEITRQFNGDGNLREFGTSGDA